MMERFGGKTTVILMMHRPRLAKAADQVLFMQGGRLLADGRHQDLLENVREYRALWAFPDTA